MKSGYVVHIHVTSKLHERPAVTAVSLNNESNAVSNVLI